MEPAKIIRTGISAIILFMYTRLWGNPYSEEKIQEIIHRVQCGTLPVEEAAKILKDITEKTPSLAETPSFKEALLACYANTLSGDKLKCYEELSQWQLWEPLFCAIEDSFEKYNSSPNKDLKFFLLKDIKVPECYDYLNEDFHLHYEYWSMAIIAWILKQRAKNGDTNAKETLDEAIASLKKPFRYFTCISRATKKLLPLLEMDDPFAKSPQFQKALEITFPHIPSIEHPFIDASRLYPAP